MSKILEKIEKLRNEYFMKWKNVPIRLDINYKLFIQLRKELLYTPFGFHRILYYNNTTSILGMNIVIDLYEGMIVTRL